MQITVIGIGYVGLVTAACLAEAGHSVLCLDIDEKKIAQLKRGVIPIYEPGLQEIVRRNSKEKRLFFATDYASAIAWGLLCFIAVDTPPLANRQADLSAVQKVVEAIAKHMTEYRVIVSKSTVPVGTCKQIEQWMCQVLGGRGTDISFDVVSNPEFLKEGSAIADFMKPDRVIVGSHSARAISLMQEVYSPFMWSRERLLVMDPLSAEMTKYASNAMLATRIAFMDELSHLCEELHADIHQVRLGMGADPRIGYDFLWAGIGYGGSCLPKDVRALIAQGEQRGCLLGIIKAVDEANMRQSHRFLEKILDYFSERRMPLQQIHLGILGLSFKPETDDMRSAPSIPIIRTLLEHGASVRLYDPVAMENAKRIFPPSQMIAYCQNEEEAALDVDALLLLTEWKPFRLLPLPRILENMRGRAFFDGRNQYSPEKMRDQGFDYISMGRPAAYAVDFEEQKAKEIDLVYGG